MRSLNIALGRISILAKIYVVIALFALCLIVISFASRNTVGNLRDGLEEYAFNSTRLIKLGLSIQADLNAIGYNQVNMIVESQTIYSNDGAEILRDFIDTRNALKNSIEGNYSALTDMVEASQAPALTDFWHSFGDWAKIDEQITEAAIAGSPEVAFALAAGEAARVREDALITIGKLVEDINARSDGRALQLIEDVETDNFLLLIAAIIVTIAGCAFGSLVGIVGIQRPIRRLNLTMALLAGGNRDIGIPDCERKDSLGEMARTLGIFQENSVRIEQLKADQIAADAKAEQEKQQSLLQVAELFQVSIGKIVTDVGEAVKGLHDDASDLSETAIQTTRESEGADQSSQVASRNIQTVEAATEHLRTSIVEISRQAGDARMISRQAVEEADRTNQTVTGLEDATTRIDDVVKLISDIAKQTNLLALNATIEAARAGEAGKGFVVVAQEVKTLASQTSQATETIISQIATIQSITRDVVNVMRGIGGTIARIDAISNSVTAAVEQQTAATQEIVQSVHHSSEAILLLQGNIDRVNRAAQHSANRVSRVHDATEGLKNTSNHLKDEVAGFLHGLQSG